MRRPDAAKLATAPRSVAFEASPPVVSLATRGPERLAGEIPSQRGPGHPSIPES